MAEMARGAETSDLDTLAMDVSGRLTKGFEGHDRFHRWGKHYIRSMCRSHQLMQQTNFMDQSLQAYGGPFFNKLKKEGEKAFLLIPFAKPFKPAAPVPKARP